MKIADDIRNDLTRIVHEHLVREHLADKVVDVTMTRGLDHAGEDGLFITVYFREEDLTVENFLKIPDFGLHVIKKMNEDMSGDMDDVFPYIRFHKAEMKNEARA